MNETKAGPKPQPKPRPPETQIETENYDTPQHDNVLDPRDPFEAALIEIVNMNRRKRRDYAIDGDPFSNFEFSSSMLGVSGFGPTEAILFNLSQKFARLNSLRRNGRMAEAANESVVDTYLDIAVYSVILYAWVKSQLDPYNLNSHGI